ncbi:hypothetical protein SAMN05444157_1489 [Frankineae bacterium MT45]|nr:hypothetical protein SAMN05444157_1489 [Frankineae bacterium MT45]
MKTHDSIRDGLRRGVALTGCAAVALTALVGCSSGQKHAQKSTSHQAIRWWTDAAGANGSKIDMKNPTADAANLKPDTKSYCSVLSSTMAAGKTPFSGFSSDDPAVGASTQAWLAELTALAPAELAPSWKTYSTGILALLSAATKPTAALPSFSAADQSAQTAALAAISADAKTSCNLTLFATSSSATSSVSAAVPSSSK